MMPAGPLMVEHRLIERMIALLANELESIRSGEGNVNIFFIQDAIDFIRTYADRCHHGKEEDILFKDLKKKELSKDHNRILDELIQEHIYARETTKKLSLALSDYSSGKIEEIMEIETRLGKLVEFYPGHIEKEDKRFFLPVMDYFTHKEKEQMLDEFWEFDKKLIHEKYRKLVLSYE